MKKTNLNGTHHQPLTRGTASPVVTSLALLLFIIGVAGCGQAPPNEVDAQSDESDGAPVIEAQQSPVGIKRQPDGSPVVGGRPIMPAQHRVTEPPVNRTVVADDLRVPWDMDFTDGGQHLYFTERPGKVGVVSFQDTTTIVQTLLTRDEVLHWGEGGLMGLALHPDFKTTGGPDNWIYLCETYGDYNTAKNRIVRVKPSSDTPLKRTTENQVKEVQTLVDEMPAASYHDGCRLEFGPDGMLYATMGDAGDPDSAQDRTSWSGNILRMTPEGEPASGNPFDGDSEVPPYVYTYGHRNPQGLAWHPTTGELYSSEHGPSGDLGLSGHDEINRIVRGANYGWPRTVGAPGLDEYRDPLMMFHDPHFPPAGMDFTGRFEETNNATSLFFGGLRGEALIRAQFDPSGTLTNIERWFEESFYDGSLGRIRAVETGPGGDLFIATSNRDGRGDPRKQDDRIIRLSPSSP